MALKEAMRHDGGSRMGRAVADANLFERDLLRHAERAAESWVEFAELFEELGRPQVLRSRAPVALPPAEAAIAEAPTATQQAPFPTNCTTLSVYRRVPLEHETAALVTAATATTPPVASITRTAVPRIADFEIHFPLTGKRVSGTQVLIVNTGRALIDTGHFRVDPADATRFQVRVKGQLCHPARTGDRTKLPEGTDRLPVVLIIHGNHASIDFDFADSGGPRRTVTSGGVTTTLIPARASIAFEVPNHLGYTNLQQHLARQGIVSVSIDTNAANTLDSLMAFRGELGLAMLDHLRELDRDATSALSSRLDLTRVGVVGHSRGGDAVAILATRNARRPVERAFGIRSVVQIAPTDFTGLTTAPLRMNRTITDSYLGVYGSHDGDVSGAFDPSERSMGWGFGGTAFRHYDRSGTDRAMVFIHGATHNRFNSVWITPSRHRAGSDARALADKQADNFTDATTVDPALPPATADPPGPGQRDRRVLSDTAHRTLMREYIGGWLFKHLQGSTAANALFNGTGNNSLRTRVALQWKHGQKARTIDFFDDPDARRSDVGGASTTPAFVTERLIELSQPANTPHHDKVLRAGAPSGAVRVYTTTIPSGKRDFSTFSHLTFRMSKVFPDLRTPQAITRPTFPARIDVALFDGTNRRSVDAATIATLNPRARRPYHRTRGGENLTKVDMQTFAVPLARYTGGTGPVNLSAVQAVEITFHATAGEEIHLDTLSVVGI